MYDYSFVADDVAWALSLWTYFYLFVCIGKGFKHQAIKASLQWLSNTHLYTTYTFNNKYIQLVYGYRGNGFLRKFKLKFMNPSTMHGKCFKMGLKYERLKKTKIHRKYTKIIYKL